MHTVIKGAASIDEYRQVQQRMADLAELAYQRHKADVKNWNEGEPVKAWFEEGCDICVEYASGVTWHYQYLELPFPKWW